MSLNTLEILRRDTLSEGGFAGLREHRLVMGEKFWGDRVNSDAWSSAGTGSDGDLDNFVYLADARFNPNGETTMHPHREIDVISIMVEGRIAHDGSLEQGAMLHTHSIQVQRAGGEGFTHNEVNPDNIPNRMLQLWVLPEVKGEPAEYKKFTPSWGERLRIYGGTNQDALSYTAETTIDVAMLVKGQQIELKAPYLAYIAKGEGTFGDLSLKDGDLIRGRNGTFNATSSVQFILVSKLKS